MLVLAFLLVMALHFFTAGSFVVPRMVFESRFAFGRIRSPITVAVIEYPDGSAVLIDVGFSRREMADPAGELGSHGATLDLSAGQEDSAVVQLRARGIRPEAVRMIIATHMHLDHVGAYVDFPNAEIVALQDEIDSARARGHRSARRARV